MTHHTIYKNAARYLLPLILIAPLGSALSECLRDDIDHYLDRGFTPEQITQICGSPGSRPDTAKEATPAAPQPTGMKEKTATAVAENNATALTSSDATYIQTVLDAETVTITKENLILVQDRCFHYGAENSIGFQQSICGAMETSIARRGLKVMQVTNPIPLLREAELIIEANIHRKTVFKQQLKDYDRKAFLLYYPEMPKTLNLKPKKGHKPTEVAAAIERLAHTTQ